HRGGGWGMIAPLLTRGQARPFCGYVGDVDPLSFGSFCNDQGGFMRALAGASFKVVRRAARVCLACLVVMLLLVSASSSAGAGSLRPRAGQAANPIQNIVVILQENHSFDELLGGLCVTDGRCDSVTSGKISSGATIHLAPSPDVSPGV